MASKGLIAEVAGWLGESALGGGRSGIVRQWMQTTVDDFADRAPSCLRTSDLMVTVRGTWIRVGVVETSHRGRTWCAGLEAPTWLGRGVSICRSHAWRDRALPESAARDGSADLPALGAWREVTRHGAGVTLVGDAERVRAWVDSPATRDDLARVAEAVATAARWDAVLTRTLTSLPEATLTDDDRLCPAARLDPDGIVVGFRPSTAVIRFDGREHELGRLEADPARLRAAIEGIRARRARSVGPYR
jgi:hypothetical protein